MPGSNLGTAYVQVMPSAEGISGSLKNIFAGEAESAGAHAGGLFSKGFGGKIKSGLKVAGVGLLAFGAAGTAVMAKGIKDTAEYGDNVDKMSQKIGFTAEEYQKWDYVMKRAGADVDSMQSSMKTLSSAATNNSEAFQKLGISQEQVASMSQGELFEETIKRLSAMENQTERTALASQLLGRGATELGPLFNEGTEAIEEQMEMAEKYGMVMSDEAVKASADFADAQTTLQMTMTGFKNRVMGDFLPSVTAITNGLAKLLTGDLAGWDEIVAGFGQMIEKLKEKLPQMLELGGEIISSIVTGITNAIPKLAEKGVELINNLGNGTDSRMGEFIKKAFELIKNFAIELGKAALKLIPAAVKKLVDIIKNTNWLELGKSMITKLFNGIKAILPTVWEYLKNFVRDVFDALGFTGLFEKVKNVFNTIKDAIWGPIQTAKDLVSGAIDRIRGLFPISMGKIFSGIKLPHFRISGGRIPWGIGGMGEKPSVDIEWYAKGAILKKPILFGGGEAGPEAVMPLSKLDQMLTGTDYDAMASAITRGLGSVNLTTIVTIDGKEVARTTAPFMQDELNRIQTRQNRKLGYV